MRLPKFFYPPYFPPTHRIKHHLRWAFIHTAVLIFFCDVIACAVPWFRLWWIGRQQILVALAALLAAVAEYFAEEEVKEIIEHEHGTPDGRGREDDEGG